MTTINIIVSIAALLTSLVALSFALLNRWYGVHFSSAVECRKVLESDGQQREHYSFTASRANTFIGRTVGRVYIRITSARYDRMARKHRPIPNS